MGAESYELCSTYAEASAAVSKLSGLSTLILDCEGRDIGMPGGALSLIAISDSQASHVFLFDVVALSDVHEPLLAPLLDLLRDPDVTKLVWDGRCDFLEIMESYGVEMGGVLDLQLVEVAQRRSHLYTKPNTGRARHTLDWFKYLRDRPRDLKPTSPLLDGIHRVFGMDHCAKLFQLLRAGEGKDEEVVAMHRWNGSAIWMQRPLQSKLLRYAAHDLTIIARLYAHFCDARGGFLDDIEELKEMSARYMYAIPTREMRALYVAKQDLPRFVPMDVLDAPLDDEKHKCGRCERELTLSCFTTEMRSGAMMRKSFCRLCDLLARNRRGVPAVGWVEVIEY